MGIWLSFHVLPCCVEQDFLLNLLDGRIVCKNIWLCHVLSFYVEQDFQLNLHIGHIAYNDIWLPHVLPFCVQHFQSQMWIEGCIDCMGIWLLHILPFSVEQNVPFNLLDDCIACKGIWLFHVQIFCWVRFPFVIALRSHCMQGNWAYSFTALLCFNKISFCGIKKSKDPWRYPEFELYDPKDIYVSWH